MIKFQSLKRKSNNNDQQVRVQKPYQKFMDSLNYMQMFKSFLEINEIFFPNLKKALGKKLIGMNEDCSKII